MHPDLEKLLDLQSKDLALKAVDTALATTPTRDLGGTSTTAEFTDTVLTGLR